VDAEAAPGEAEAHIIARTGKKAIMYHPYWFGVKVEFMCEKCGVTSIWRDVINSSTEDFDKLQSTIDSQHQRCRYCEGELQDGADVDIQIVPGTPEYLRGLEFPVPVDADGK